MDNKDKYNQDNSINVVEILMSIREQVSSLNTEVKEYQKHLDSTDKKIEEVDKKASEALNIARENEKSMNSQNDNNKQKSDHSIQYITTFIGAIGGPILVSLIMKLFHM